MVALARKKIVKFEKAIAKFQSKQQSGQVSVAAALKGIGQQLSQVAQSGNIVEQVMGHMRSTVPEASVDAGGCT